MFICLWLTLSIAVGCATSAKTPSRTINKSEESTEEKWGIKIKSVRVSAAGYMLDFRYRVINPEKASLILKRENKPYLIDQATGTKLAVPRTKIGPLRQTSVKPIAGRDYSILFGNQRGLVKPGDKVNIIIGDFKVEDITVE